MGADLTALGYTEMSDFASYYRPCPEHEPINPWLADLDPVKVKEYCDAAPHIFPVTDLKVLLP